MAGDYNIHAIVSKIHKKKSFFSMILVVCFNSYNVI